MRRNQDSDLVQTQDKCINLYKTSGLKNNRKRILITFQVLTFNQLFKDFP